MSATDVRAPNQDPAVETARRLRELQLSLQRLSLMDSAARLVAAAPHELCQAVGFDRAMFSYLRGDRIVFGSVSDDDHPILAADFARLARAVRPRLDVCGPEHETVVRQMPVLVRDAKRAPGVFRPLTHVARTDAYVVAPIVRDGQTVALLHADRFEGSPLVGELDREILWTFASGLGWIMDRLATRDEAEAAPEPRDEAEAIAALEAPSPLAEPDPVLVRLATLTSRELEVLQLMAEGASNAGIGETLVISHATVKSHVRQILRKLRAANRTEAVSQFLAGRGRASAGA